MERLNDYDVQRALRCENINHPVFTIWNKYQEEIRNFGLIYPTLSKKEQDEFVKCNFGFFAEGVEEIGQFTLNPLEIIALWTKVRDSFFPRYTTSTILGLGYSTFPLDRDIWKGAVSYYFKNNSFPEIILDRRDDLSVVRCRLDEVSDNINAIEFYVYGVEGGISRFVEALQSNEKEIISKFQEAQERIDNTPDIRFLANIRENFSNGFLPLRFYLEELQDK